MPPKWPLFRFHNKHAGELLWASTSPPRAKDVAAMIKKQKGDGVFGRQLTKEQVCQEQNIKFSN